MNKAKEQKQDGNPALVVKEASKGKQSSDNKDNVASAYTSPSQSNDSDAHCSLLSVHIFKARSIFLPKLLLFLLTLNLKMLITLQMLRRDRSLS